MSGQILLFFHLLFKITLLDYKTERTHTYLAYIKYVCARMIRKEFAVQVSEGRPRPQHSIYSVTSPVYGQTTLERKCTTDALTTADNTVLAAQRLGGIWSERNRTQV